MAISQNLSDTAKRAADFIDSLSPIGDNGALVVGLSGDLGAGKTAFVQAAAAHLGVKDTVTSPTFILEKIYKLEHARFEHLIHIDAYRLEKPEEMLQLGWKEIVENPKNLILIEWPERIEAILPKNYKKIRFGHINETSRDIVVE